MNRKYLIILGTLFTSAVFGAPPLVFEGSGPDVATLTPTRDAFRAAVGGGAVAGANGDFGGVRREINWDAVPAARSDPNALPADFFNVNSPRGVVFSTPGTGFLVSANAGEAVPPLFGFPDDFQTFSPQKLFTAVNSPITDISFFVPGTTTPAGTTAFGVIFTDVEVAKSTKVEFFDAAGNSIFDRDVLVGGNRGLSFLGAIVDPNDPITRVRITSGQNTIVSNGVLGNQTDDIVVMDDFIYATPAALPDGSPGLALVATVLAGMAGLKRRIQKS
jgi:hypothetical protein